MNVVDIIISILLLFGFIRGILKGLFVELASIVALVAGVYGAIHFSDYAANFLEKYVSWKTEYIYILEFAITFIVIVLVITLIGKALTKVADLTALGLLNKILGGLFGILKVGFILSILITFFSKLNNTIPFIEEETLDKSVLYNPVKKIAPTIFPSFLEGEILNLEEEMKEV